jgi:DNA primase
LRQAERIVFCFDGDAAGRKAAWRALENSLEALTEQKSIAFVFLPDGEDPDSFVRQHGGEAFQRMIMQATPLSDFLLGELSAHCDLSTAEGSARLVAEAKPLLGRLQSSLLRLQLVKRLAQASGFSQAEVERLCELRPLTQPAPARAPRQAPSLLRPLLRLLLQKPQLAPSLPLDLLPDNSTEAMAVRLLCETIAAAGTQQLAYPTLIERLRGSECEDILCAAAAELMQESFAEDQVDAEFTGAVQQLLERAHKRVFKQLQEKARKLGVNGLSSEEKRQYLAALMASGRLGAGA